MKALRRIPRAAMSAIMNTIRRIPRAAMSAAMNTTRRIPRAAMSAIMNTTRRAARATLSAVMNTLRRPARIIPKRPIMQTTTRRLTAILALAAALAAAFTLLPPHNSALAQGTGTATATATPTDYDTDDDGLIEIDNLAKLNAIRWDLNGDGNPASGAATTNYNAAFANRDATAAGRMGCPLTDHDNDANTADQATCTGYELTANLDFDTNGDGSVTTAGDTYWNGGKGWLIMGDYRDELTTTLNGNGHTINNLYMNRDHPNNDPIGLFCEIGSGGRIESLGITNANITSLNTSIIGIFAGRIVSGGEIVASYSTGSVTVNGANAGGLVGVLHNGSIHSSYSTASVSSAGNPLAQFNVGGLVGQVTSSANTSITNSYATGAVTRGAGTETSFGGLVGALGSQAAGFTATNSYYDTTTSGCVSSSTTGCTGDAAGAVGKTTSELQTPTGYTGIYSTWNANVDGVAGNDAPWAFGTSSQYPTLILHITNDYDIDDDGLIDVENLAQLNAIRRDLDADGNATHADYASAFPRRETGSSGRMGCPSGACTGYELTADLDFDTNGDGSITAADTYYHAGAGWSPIGTSVIPYSGNFKGNGYALDNLFIDTNAQANIGLFGVIDSGTRIESLDVTNASITGGAQTGILAGFVKGEIVACYTSGSVTATTIEVGGIAGKVERAQGDSGAVGVLSSHSTASVTGTASVGGLIGRFYSGAVTHNYATGLITRSSGTSSYIGGLIGRAATSGITDNYYDTSTSGCVSGGSNGCTGSAGGSEVVGRTSTQLKTPTGYTGIYSTWNANLDGQTGADDPWNFGASTDYPTLKYGRLVDYDSDNDGYIEITTLAQLDAVRRDLNSNGDSAHDDYIAAFPNRFIRPGRLMGCPSGRCVGYELDADLDFDTDGDGAVDSDDDYWNSGAGWVPLGPSNTSRYTGNFKGNGHTINNLYINRSSNDQGLFGRLSGRIETLGVTNASVSGANSVGVLAGTSFGTIVACYTSGKAKGTGIRNGGLVGYSHGTVSTSYSTAYVEGNHTIGGLIGYQHDGSVTNSYATGRLHHTHHTDFRVGGLMGHKVSGTISNSFWDILSTGRSATQGGDGTAGSVGKTPRQLQTVTSYTGIYANWNANLDGVAGNDDPWDFGNGMQYPMLDYDGMSTAPQGGLAMGIPDNWNAPIVGERVGVCLTAAARPNRNGAWIWEKSANGDTWGPVGGNSGPTYEYNPVAADSGSFLRAKVELNDGSFAYSRILGGRVKNASTAADATQGSAATFYSGNTSPQVGSIIIANDPRPTGAVDQRFQWQRCDNADTTYTDCEYLPGFWWNNYTPVAADLNHYIRMIVYYETSAGVWTRHATAFTGQVAAASQ